MGDPNICVWRLVEVQMAAPSPTPYTSSRQRLRSVSPTLRKARDNLKKLRSERDSEQQSGVVEEGGGGAEAAVDSGGVPSDRFSKPDDVENGEESAEVFLELCA